MKKRIALLVVLVLGLCVGLNTESVGGGSANEQRHRNWTSFSFITDEGKQFAGLSTTGIEDSEKTTLFLGVYPPQCTMGFPVIIACGQSGKNLSAKPGRASIRVDNREICEADVSFSFSDGCVTASIEKIYNGDLLNDAVRGNTVRFKLEIQGGEPIYKKYSLIGFTDAFNRAMGICTGIRDRQVKPKKDEDYFSPSAPYAPMPNTAPIRKKADEDYFI